MKTGNDLGRDSVPSLVLKLAIPTMVAQFVNVLYSIIDRMYIGHIPEYGDLALAGAGICGPIVTLLSSFGTLVGLGGSIQMSIRMGERNMKKARQILSNSLLLLTLFSAVLTVLFLMIKGQLLRWFGASDQTFAYANTYLTIYTIGTFFALMAVGLNYFINCQGFPVIGMTTVLIGTVCNIILDPVMIFGLGPFPKMGIEGAALATGIGQAAGAVLYLIFYIVNPLPVKYRKKYLKADLKLWKKLYVIGIPASLNLALPSLLISVLNVILTGYGEVYVFVLGVYYKLQTFLYLPANGIVQGMRPLLGYNYGAGEHKRVHKIFQDGLILVLVMMAAGMAICLAVPGQLMGLFTANPITMKAGSVALRVISLGFLASSVSVICSGALEGLGKGVHSLIISLCRYVVVIIPVAFIVSRFMGAVGVWHAFWITEVVTAVIAYVVYRKGVKG